MSKKNRFISFVFSLIFIFSALSSNVLAAEVNTVPSGFDQNKITDVIVVDSVQPRSSTTFTVEAGGAVSVNIGKCDSVSYSLSYTPASVYVYFGVDNDKNGTSVLQSNSTSNGKGSNSYSGSYGQKYIYVVNDSASSSITVTLTYDATTSLRAG